MLTHVVLFLAAIKYLEDVQEPINKEEFNAAAGVGKFTLYMDQREQCLLIE